MIFVVDASAPAMLEEAAQVELGGVGGSWGGVGVELGGVGCLSVYLFSYLVT